jgi:hypothetical protein
MRPIAGELAGSFEFARPEPARPEKEATMRMGFGKAAIALAALWLSAAPAAAGTITLDFNLKGSFSQGGLNNGAFGAAPGNVLTGHSTSGDSRSYFVFDLSGITDPIVSATLSVGNPFRGYFSSDPTETWTVFDYTGAIGELQNQSTHDTGVYADLGDGNSYGSRTVSNADNPDCSGGCTINSYAPVDVALGGAAFVADINAARGGLFALGSALTSTAGNGSTQFLFGFTGNNIPAQLVLETGAVPEPSSLAILLAGLALVRCRRRTARQRA